jgi:hypothetical protein
MGSAGEGSSDIVNYRLPSRDELGKTRIVKFAGKIYHHYLIGTKVRIEYRIRYLVKRFDSRSVGRTVLFCPDKPDYTQVLYKICNSVGYAMTSSVGPAPDLVVAFQDVTKRADSPELLELAANGYVVNQHCDDISKIKVEDVFLEIFGYGTFVDPATYVGQCVMKSDDNAMHDGEVVECPSVATRNDVIFQRLINNTTGDEVLDIRVPIVRDQIPFVYLKYRRVRSRFSNMNSRVHMAAPDSVFSGDETAKIKRFAERLGLDFGELDVLRDVDDGKIYIIDVNNTPCGPPNHLGRAGSKRAVQLLTQSFNTEFFAGTSERVAHRKDVR